MLVWRWEKTWLEFSPTEWRRPKLTGDHFARKATLQAVWQLRKRGLLDRRGRPRSYEYLRVGDIRTAYPGRKRPPSMRCT